MTISEVSISEVSISEVSISEESSSEETSLLAPTDETPDTAEPDPDEAGAAFAVDEPTPDDRELEELVAVEPAEPVESANATAGKDAAAPTPNATANAATRPTRREQPHTGRNDTTAAPKPADPTRPIPTRRRPDRAERWLFTELTKTCAETIALSHNQTVWKKALSISEIIRHHRRIAKTALFTNCIHAQQEIYRVFLRKNQAICGREEVDPVCAVGVMGRF